MNDNLLERYLYDVVRRLPEKQRSDIEQELRTLIEDMMEEKGEFNKDANDTLKEVLNELGDPAKLAAQYRGSEEHLIGGEYYPIYCQVLKVVLMCVGIAMLVVFCVSNLTSVEFITESESVAAAVTYYAEKAVSVVSLPSALIQAFAYVTLVFFLLERYQVKLDDLKVSWNTARLPQIPYKKVQIKRGEQIFSIIFGCIFFVVLTFMPGYIGAWFKEDDIYKVVTIINLEAWKKVLPLFIISVSLDLIAEVIKLISGVYNKLVLVSSLLLKGIGMILSIALITTTGIWNENFMQEVSRKSGFEIPDGDWLDFINAGGVIYIIVAIIAISFLIEMLVTIYKAIQYHGGLGRV
jgi:hypothetical protein